MHAITWRKQSPLLALFCANFISLTGSALTTLAIPWFVLQTTGSVVKTGISAFFTIVPTILANFLGGVLVDRVGYKRISVISDLMAGAGILLIPLFYNTVGLPFVVLLLLIFLATLLNGPGGTARLSLIPDLAEFADMPLERATSISQGIGHIAILVGAPLAGVLIALIGTSNLLWIDALSFGLSALVVSVAVPLLGKVSAETTQASETAQTQEQQVEPTPGEKPGFLADLWRGMLFILRDKLILAILFTLVMTNMLDTSVTAVVTPFYVKQIFGNAVVLGLMDAAFVGAALLGTVLYGVIGHRLRRDITLAFALVFVGVRFWVLALIPPLPFILLVMAVSGFAASPLNPIIFTIAYERIPPEIRGRVLGIGMAFTALGMPVGVLASGYLLNGIGIPATLLIMGASYLLVSLSLLLNPALYKAQKVHPVPNEPQRVAVD